MLLAADAWQVGIPVLQLVLQLSADKLFNEAKTFCASLCKNPHRSALLCSSVLEGSSIHQPLEVV